MKITVIISAMLIAQVSAAFFDVFQGAVLSVQNSFGKLFSDVVTDVKDTVDCTILAVEHVLSLSQDATARYYEKCGRAPNGTVTEKPKEVILPTVEISISNNEEYLKKVIPEEIDARINATLSRLLNGYNPHDKLEDVERALAKETEILANVSELVKQELEKMSNVIHLDFKNLEHNDSKPSVDSILEQLKLLEDIEQNIRNTPEAKEIHRLIDDVLHKLNTIEAADTSENAKVERILKDLEDNSNSSYTDLRQQIKSLKADEERHIELIKIKLEEHDKSPEHIAFLQSSYLNHTLQPNSNVNGINSFATETSDLSLQTEQPTTAPKINTTYNQNDVVRTSDIPLNVSTASPKNGSVSSITQIPASTKTATSITTNFTTLFENPTTSPVGNTQTPSATTESPSTKPAPSATTEPPSTKPALSATTESSSTKPAPSVTIELPSTKSAPSVTTESPSTKPAPSATTESPSTKPVSSATTEPPSTKPAPSVTTEPPSTKPALSATTESPSTKPAPSATTEPPSTKPALSATTESPSTKPAPSATTEPPSTKPAPSVTTEPPRTKLAPSATTESSSTKPVPSATTEPSSTKPVPSATTEPSSTKPAPSAITEPPSTKPAPSATIEPPSTNPVPSATTESPSIKPVPSATTEPPSTKQVPSVTTEPPNTKPAPSATTESPSTKPIQSATTEPPSTKPAPSATIELFRSIQTPYSTTESSSTSQTLSSTTESSSTTPNTIETSTIQGNVNMISTTPTTTTVLLNNIVISSTTEIDIPISTDQYNNTMKLVSSPSPEQTNVALKSTTPVAITTSSYANENNHETPISIEPSILTTIPTTTLHPRSTIEVFESEDPNHVDQMTLKTTTLPTTVDEDESLTTMPTVTTANISKQLSPSRADSDDDTNDNDTVKITASAAITETIHIEETMENNDAGIISTTTEPMHSSTHRSTASTPSLNDFLSYIDRIVSASTTTTQAAPIAVQDLPITMPPVRPYSEPPPYLKSNTPLPAINTGLLPSPRFMSPQNVPPPYARNIPLQASVNMPIPPGHMAPPPRLTPLAYNKPPYPVSNPTVSMNRNLLPPPRLAPPQRGYKPNLPSIQTPNIINSPSNFFNRPPMSMNVRPVGLTTQIPLITPKTNNFDDPDYNSFFHTPSKDTDAHAHALREARQLIADSKRSHRIMDSILNGKRGRRAFGLPNALKFGK